MPSDLPLRCRCGRMRGVASNISPSSGLRFVCYCKDCQAFARFLDRADVLDPAGGTDIFHMPPGRVKLTAGTDALRACASPTRSCVGTPNVAGRRLPTPPLGRASRSSAWFIPSWTTRPTVIPGTRCSVRRSAVSSNALPSGRSRRTRPVRRRSGFSPAAPQSCSAGGCAGSVGPRRSSTIGRRLRAPSRACSRRANAPLFEKAERSSSFHRHGSLFRRPVRITGDYRATPSHPYSQRHHTGDPT
jgi:Family of unknown function (DUF6151)